MPEQTPEESGALSNADETLDEETRPGSNSEIREAIAQLRSKVSHLEQISKRHFYKNSAFWAGITTVPLIFASGWLIKASTERPFLLREIHRLLGTEPALIAALDEKDNEFKDAILSLQSRTPFLTTMFRLGLLEEYAQQLKCLAATKKDQQHKAVPKCDIPNGALVNTAQTTFSVVGYDKVNVGVVISITEQTYTDDGYIAVKSIDHSDEADLLNKIRITINEKELNAEQYIWSPHYFGKRFTRYQLKGLKIPKAEIRDFPVNTLSVYITEDMGHKYYSVTVAVVIAPDDDDERKASKDKHMVKSVQKASP